MVFEFGKDIIVVVWFVGLLVDEMLMACILGTWFEFDDEVK